MIFTADYVLPHNEITTLEEKLALLLTPTIEQMPAWTTFQKVVTCHCKAASEQEASPADMTVAVHYLNFYSSRAILRGRLQLALFAVHLCPISIQQSQGLLLFC